MRHQRLGRADMYWKAKSIMLGWFWTLVAHCPRVQVECLGRDQSCKQDRIPYMCVSTFGSCDIRDDLRRTIKT